jgi:MYXO-CTERM domain-containing protein
MKSKLVISFSASIALAMVTTQAQTISVDLLNASGQAITGSYGVSSQGTVVGGWNNPIKLYSDTGLLFSDASSSTVGFTLSTPSGAYQSYNAAWAGTPLAGGPDVYGTPTTLTLNNLNANFASGYWIIAYVGGFNANNGASISDGTDTFFYRSDPAPANPYGPFVQTTQTTDLGVSANPIAQYAVFGGSSTPLTSDSLVLTLSTITGGAGGGAIGGFQIIGATPVPEPATAAVALVGVGLLGLVRRQSRKQD